jgi:hypothetical protein
MHGEWSMPGILAYGEKREMEINGKMIGSCDDDDVVDTNVTYL